MSLFLMGTLLQHHSFLNLNLKEATTRGGIRVPILYNFALHILHPAGDGANARLSFVIHIRTRSTSLNTLI